LLVPLGKTVLSSRQSGKVLSTKQCIAGKQALVTQQSWTKQDCQQWIWKAGQAGYLQLQNSQSSQLCLQVKQDALAAGAELQLGDCETKSSQWALQVLENGAFSLFSPHTKHWVDVPACSLFDDVNLKQAPASADSLCQQFQLRAAD
jgi:hypothetical protein